MLAYQLLTRCHNTSAPTIELVVVVRMLTLRLRSYRSDISLDLRQIDSRLCTSDYIQIMRGLVCFRVFGRYRCPDLCFRIRKLKIRRHDADDGVAGAIEYQVLSDNVVVSSKAALPQAVTNYCYLIATGLVFLK